MIYAQSYFIFPSPVMNLAKLRSLSIKVTSKFVWFTDDIKPTELGTVEDTGKRGVKKLGISNDLL